MADGPVVVTINGVDKTAFVERTSLTIRDSLNQPKTCKFTTLLGYQPPPTATVTVNRGTIALFAGTVTVVTQTYRGGNPADANLVWEVSVTNYNFLLRRRRPTGSWVATSATTIAQSLITNFVTGGFTSTNVQAALAAVTIDFDASQDAGGALSALAALIGAYWYVDESRDLHFFITEASSTPDPIDNSNTAVYANPPLTSTLDYNNIQTVVDVVGAGTTTVLPTAIGATVLPVAANGMFSASGGSARVAPAQFITYTGVGAGFISNLATWASRSATLGRNWQGVIWADALGLFVAVAGDVAPSTIMTSPDGITWTNRTSPNNATWTAITWASSLSLLCAVASSGEVMTSPDSITWTARTAAAANAWEGICWSGSLFVAVAGTGANRVMTSPDGITWTSRTAAVAAVWEGVAWSPSLSLFCAVGDSVNNAIMTSPTGTTWTQRTGAPINGAWKGVAWSDTLALFVAVGGTFGTASGVVATSPDGIIWTQRTAANTNPWVNVIWASGFNMFIAVSIDGTNDSRYRIMASPDGITWSAYPEPQTGTWQDIAWSTSLGRLVVVGINSLGSPNTMVMTSDQTPYATLTGVSGLTIAVIQGAVVRVWVQRTNAAAVAALAAIEDGGTSDGVHIGFIDDSTLDSVTKCNQAGDAALAAYDAGISTVHFLSTDLKIRSGKPITINRTHPPISSITLTIQDVEITHLFDAAPQGPQYSVMASPSKFTLVDFFAQLAIAKQ